MIKIKNTDESERSFGCELSLVETGISLTYILTIEQRTAQLRNALIETSKCTY